MEEEVGVKVTRLRRRLSVEADDVKSPSTQSTPNKKRGGRLAAKPQLELINENATDIEKPKRTRKSIARDVEPDEKAVTPSRRSTRIRSNTSIVSETPLEVEEKGTPSKRNTRVRSNTSIVSEIPLEIEEKGTPARRSTRIKSNTSIVAETSQHVASPRAKRAARRTSQAGSDNETTITPGRSTRRTRKDSASSIDKQAEHKLDKVEPQVTEVIIEETDSTAKDLTTNKTPNKDTSITVTTRKSPRIVEKTSKNSPNHKNTTEKIENDKDPKDENSINSIAVNTSISTLKDASTDKKHDISVTSSSLIKQLDDVPRKGNASLNKTTSAVEEAQLKAKRRRTKSWTIASLNSSNDNNFLSDTEATTRNKIKRSKLKDGSGENDFNTSDRSIGKNEELVTSSNKKNKKNKDKSLIDLETKVPSSNSFTDNKDLSPQTEANFTENFFRDAPKGAIQSLVYIEDSDSNTGNVERDSEQKENESGDQCVPVVEHQLENNSSKEAESDHSYEPMDIDETMPENVSLVVSPINNTSAVDDIKVQSTKIEIAGDNNIPANKSKNKSMIGTEDNVAEVDNNSFSKSKRKSSNSETNYIRDNDLTNISSVNDSTKEGSKSNRKLSNSFVDSDANISLSKKSSKRKSSISKPPNNEDEEGNGIENEDSNNKETPLRDLDKRDNKNLSTSNNDDNKKRKSLVIPNNDNDGSEKESSTAKDEVDSSFNKSNNDVERGNISSDKSNRKSANAIDDNVNNSFSESNKESTVSGINNKNDHKTGRKSSVSKIDSEDLVDSALNKSSNKSKRKSSLSDMESQVFDKSNIENKSTLVLSNIKDLSESSVAKPLRELNKSKDQLSQSVNMPNINKEKKSNKLNLSLTYSTSTPIQEKPLRKLGMQMNSSIITPNNVGKKKQNSSLDRSKNKTPVFSHDDTTELSDEDDENTSEDENEESSNDESANKSNLIDNKAEEASEDYESGDSRHEDEREYEEQHEIVEKGETLDSDDEDFSDDSDYEKGSFIVDSDEEDAELLSGSGDDLSMSADELSMSAKSKKKFNERKTKEQKKASREMFEARHQMNKSNSIRKINRQRLESSQSEEEANTKTRKVKRARIDSSQDITVNQSDPDTSELKQKRKATRRLSDSVCEENPTDEKEISVHDKNETIKDDPLSLRNIVKKEPKTPQKDLNISTVKISSNAVEEVDIQNNVTIIDTNQTSDPLQTTSAENEVMEDASEDSISENEEITQNYESVLSDLNKKKSKVKTLNMSLNLNKNTKPKDQDAIMDELNLTQPKKLKKKKQALIESNQNSATKEKGKKSINNQDEGSSDSIDMKLLFNDDSTDTETKTSIQKADNTTVEEFIPLKRTQGKTNILEKRDSISEEPHELSLNVSKSKNGKRKSHQPAEIVESEDAGNLNFFIDTTGTHEDADKEANTTINKSGKKNKKKNNVSVTNIEQEINDDDTNDAPLEVSYQSNKNKSKQVLDVSQTVEKVVTSKDNGTPASTKKNKKNKKSLDKSQIIEVTDDTTKEGPLEVSFGGNKNKSKQLLDLSNTEEKVVETETPVSGKKNKKNKKSMDRSQIIEVTDNTNNDIPLELSFQNDKNKSKQDLEFDTENKSNVTPNGQKKKRKNKKSIDNSQIVEVTDIETQADKAHDISIGNTQKLQADIATSLEKATNVEAIQAVITTEETSKKRKRKLSANKSSEEKTGKDDAKAPDAPEFNESLVPTNQKKKRKISHTIDNESGTEKGPDNEEEANVPDSKPKKKSKAVAVTRTIQNSDDSTMKSKKRKERDDDDSENVSKVIKQDSLDNVHVSRLPTDVLRQLDEIPKGNKSKNKIISTTSFKVEETRKRRTKPSNYLEESVYLNDSTEEPSKNKNVKVPKVLPFIPTASTSGYGFTTTFKVNVIPQETQFVAQSSNVYNFKQDYLQKNRIKKLGTFEKYKRHRAVKISKF